MEYIILIVVLAGLIAAWWLRHTGYGGRKATKAVIHRSFAQAELEELTPEIRESTLAVLRGQGIEAAVEHLREEAHLPKAQAENVLILLARSELQRGQMFDNEHYPDPPAAPATPAPPTASPPPASNWSHEAPPAAAPSPPPASNWSHEAPPAAAPSPPPASNWSHEAPPAAAPSPPPASNWSHETPRSGPLNPPSPHQDAAESHDNAS